LRRLVPIPPEAPVINMRGISSLTRKALRKYGAPCRARQACWSILQMLATVPARKPTRT
jgi:hypothetical protein